MKQSEVPIKIKVGISSCLLGERVRYDGGHKLDHYITETLGKYMSWVPVCPEVDAGLSVPREAMRLTGDPQSPRLMTRKTNIDLTEKVGGWARNRVAKSDLSELCGFIFKSRSPSSGLKAVRVYNASGMPSMSGRGIFAAEFVKQFPSVPVIDDGRMHDPSLRENFIEQVMIYHRWLQYLSGNKSIRGLIVFHTRLKYVLMAHSPKHTRMLGKMVAEAKREKPSELHDQYITSLMEGLRLQSTVKKNTNVLQHIMGYFKKRLSSEEKSELLKIIEDYHKGVLPLIVPITMLKHYVLKYDEQYLKEQYYLNLLPQELMLRNHA